MNSFTMLHLSDIHFQRDARDKDPAFRKLAVKELLAAVKQFAGNPNHPSPDAVAITGDIAFSGKEYNEASEFFDELKGVLPGQPLFLPVPGNHDLDREKVLEYVPLYDIVRKQNEDRLLKDPKQVNHFIIPKFAKYLEFAQSLSPGLYRDESAYFWVKNIDDKKVSVMGLNSAWACQGDDDRFNIALGLQQLQQALEACTYENRILLMHHPPINWLKDFENDVCGKEVYKHCRVILCGHTHSDHAYIQCDASNATACLGANASYTVGRKGFIGFQFLRLQLGGSRTLIDVWPYVFHRGDNVFVPDSHRYRNQGGKDGFHLLLNHLSPGTAAPIPGASLEIPGDYVRWVRDYHSILPIDHLAKKGEIIRVNLPKVYIPLKTVNPFREGGKDTGREGEKKTHRMTEAGEKQATINIETLMGRVPLLLLRGGAGSGKTTLVKHLAYTLTHDGNIPGLQGFLPVIVFFRVLWPLFEQSLKEHGDGITFEALLPDYLDKVNCPLPGEVITSYLGAGRALFLLDGLDEIPETYRDPMVEMLHDFRFKYRENRFLLTGRPNGFSGKVLERFGDRIQDVEFLDSEKIKTFILKWYGAVSSQAEGRAGMTAGGMIGEIAENEHVGVFTRNPLLLTAVCILYLVGGERLPEQRAELYGRIVKNLLYRRFHDPKDPSLEEKVYDYMMTLAFSMQEKGIKTMDAHGARELLKEVFSSQPGESPRDYKKRIRDLFDKIEPHCGLLNRTSGGDVEFFHLTFQEFLAAKYMLDMDVPTAMFIPQPRWEETLLLYFGLMSMEMRKLCNDQVTALLETGQGAGKERFYVQLLACKVLRDMLPNRREAAGMALARGILENIMRRDNDYRRRVDAGDILGVIGDQRFGGPYNVVEVPGGPFLRGSNQHYGDEKPEAKIELDAFMIGRFPVTNLEFQPFVEGNGYKDKSLWCEAGWEWIQKENINVPRYYHDRKWNGSNFPVVGVSWYEACAYARWLEKGTGHAFRLPTGAEWEKAARGEQGRVYPWGEDIDAGTCNYFETGLGRTSAVGVFPGDKSVYGCMDMAGNVCEWCWDWFGEDYYEKSPSKNPQGPSEGGGRVVRGGGWGVDPDDCRASCRSNLHPSDRFDFVGFRLARSFTP